VCVRVPTLFRWAVSRSKTLLLKALLLLLQAAPAPVLQVSGGAARQVLSFLALLVQKYKY
jgi:hypothetical protein